ncbi:MAG: diguanylate cyclase, partial [Lachnospiraceae bacterium]|nr:diguanylate cyclase [Lachnospiraceae bacterium]
MVAFLTSSFVPYRGESYSGKTPLINENGFADRLREFWKTPACFLVVAADPEDAARADAVARQMETTFSDAGLPIDEVRVLDRRTAEKAAGLVSWATVIFLSGGHGPTENAFINEIRLRELLKDYSGIFIGLSAGSLNAADETIQIPELPGEAERADFPVSLPGLGITSLHIVPHAAYFRDFILDGKHYYDDILLPLSAGRRLYFIDDGSYFFINGGTTEFFGTGEIIEDGSGRAISTEVEPEVWQVVMGQGYSAAFDLDEKSGLINFRYVSDFLKEQGLNPAGTPDFPTLVRFLSDRIIVEDEKQAVIDLTHLPDIVDEVGRYGSFSRTFHYETDGSRHSADLRILPVGKRLFGYIYNTTEAIDRDWMTDTFSRTGFLKAAEKFLQEAEDASAYSLVYTNIRGFKTINDLFGQQSGDMVIFMVQSLLGEIFHPQFLCRLENDH